jgi:hypothetical protein
LAIVCKLVHQQQNLVFKWKQKKNKQNLGEGACNPSYSGGINQRDWSLTQPQANISWDPLWKIPKTKRAGRVAQELKQVWDPEFKSQHLATTKKSGGKEDGHGS